MDVHEEEEFEMPALNPLMSQMDEVITIADIGEDFKSSRKEKEDAKQQLVHIKRLLQDAQVEELRCVILTAIALAHSKKTQDVRRCAIAAVHTHLSKKHTVLQYLAENGIVRVKDMQNDLRILRLPKEDVLELIDNIVKK